MVVGRSMFLAVAFALTFGLLFLAVPLNAARKETVLHSFTGGSDGGQPYSSVTLDGAGNVYGTTYGGGAYGGGTVYELTPSKNGNWREKVLYSFCSQGGSSCTDGGQPMGQLIFDSAGNLYGTTMAGGANLGGIVFELVRGKNNTWTENILYNFCSNSCIDGAGPEAGVTFDKVGNLYGTTYYGGLLSGGVVYQLVPGQSGSWTENLLYTFCEIGSLYCEDGNYPMGGVVLDTAGNVYGTTSSGGLHNVGAVYQLTPGAGGAWTETVLHSFGSNNDQLYDGISAYASLLLDAQGNLYGTTGYGGNGNSGTVFELSPGQDGAWTENVYSLPYATQTGYVPDGSVASDAKGNLYTTAFWGGAYQGACPYFYGGQGFGCGVVFELTKSAGNWKQEILYNFKPTNDAQNPISGVTLDSTGNLYGTGIEGGAHGYGAVYEITK